MTSKRHAEWDFNPAEPHFFLALSLSGQQNEPNLKEPYKKKRFVMTQSLNARDQKAQHHGCGPSEGTC